MHRKCDAQTQLSPEEAAMFYVYLEAAVSNLSNQLAAAVNAIDWGVE